MLQQAFLELDSGRHFLEPPFHLFFFPFQGGDLLHQPHLVLSLDLLRRVFFQDGDFGLSSGRFLVFFWLLKLVLLLVEPELLSSAFNSLFNLDFIHLSVFFDEDFCCSLHLLPEAADSP